MRRLALLAGVGASALMLSGCAGFGQLMAKDIQTCDREYTGAVQGAPMVGVTGGLNVKWVCRHTVPWADIAAPAPPALPGPLPSGPLVIPPLS